MRPRPLTGLLSFNSNTMMNMETKTYTSPKLTIFTVELHRVISASLTGSTENVVTNPFLETPEEMNGGSDMEW